MKKIIERIRCTQADVVLSVMAPMPMNGNWYPNIPLPNFNLVQTLSGEEACRLSLCKPKINGNGLLTQRAFLWRILDDNDDTYINSDEIDFCKTLFYAHRVVFSNTHYHYRIHKDSITRKISPKLFETTLTNNQLYNLLTIAWEKLIPMLLMLLQKNAWHHWLSMKACSEDIKPHSRDKRKIEYAKSSKMLSTASSRIASSHQRSNWLWWCNPM